MLDEAARATPESVRALYADVYREMLAAGYTAVGEFHYPGFAEALAAANGTTDFGEYFIYFSFFLVVSALMLAALFFKLSVEQRGREVGLLRAVGFGPRDVRRIFLTEGLLLSIVGSAIGVAGGIAYSWLLMAGLRTAFGSASVAVLRRDGEGWRV